MSSLGSVLSIARGAMNAQQTIIQTAGHNIANVETPGFSRQRVELATATPVRFEYGSVGTGVTITNISQARDVLLDSTYRAESGSASSSKLRQDLLGSVEEVLGEPSDTGLAAAMDAFWSSWSDLASQPTSAAARSVVQQRGGQVAALLNGFDTRLTDLARQTTVRVNSTVDRINSLSDQVAALNGRILSSEFDGTTAGDLRDQRNLALDELATLGDMRVTQNANGTVMVHLGNNALVDGTTARHVQTVTTKSGDIALQMTNGTEPLLPVGGSVQVMMDFMNRDLKDMRGQLDALASGLVTSVNALHNTGELYPSGGAAPVAGGDFFDPTRTTAHDITLSASVAASAANIAAGAAAGANAAGPGNNEIALAMAQLRDTPAQVTYVDASGRAQSGSFTSYYNDVNSRLGTQVTNAASDAEIHSTLASQADTRRQSVSGVNLDEELTTLMRAQQAYAAAAKVISTANEMMKTLIDMT
jgi:flagellar hook-associated protein 1 FlgK